MRPGSSRVLGGLNSARTEEDSRRSRDRAHKESREFEFRQDRRKLPALTRAGLSKYDDSRSMLSHPTRGTMTMGRPVVHFEIGCRDKETTKAFFSELFGWALSDMGPATMIDT